MNDEMHSVLLIGESGVGKTHYGAQLLSRLAKSEDTALKFDFSQENINLEPFEAAQEKLNSGLAAEHTAAKTYDESNWPIIDESGKKSQLLWPDYAGEQVTTIFEQRLVSDSWTSSIQGASSWLLLVRLNQGPDYADIFSKPIPFAELGSSSSNGSFKMSHQARLIELLQIMLFTSNVNTDNAIDTPKLSVLMTCWDELPTKDNQQPAELLKEYMPMLYQYVNSAWNNPLFWGLSALGKPLDKDDKDDEYINAGPESFGYVIASDGSQSNDLTLPIQALLD